MTRLVDLDGTGSKQWEWVGPKAGLLVHGKSKPAKVDGTVLFGTDTGGQKWAHGYQPLANLDSDRSGTLEGVELAEIWVWLDADSDAEVDDGEMTPATQWIQVMSVTPEVDAEGNAWAPAGATLKNGKQVASWDWWSCAENPLYMSAKQTGYVEYAPMIVGAGAGEGTVIYEWKMDGEDRGGFLRFFQIGDDLHVVCALREVTPGVNSVKFAKVTVSEGRLQWAFSSGLSPVADGQAVRGTIGGVLRGTGTIVQGGVTALDSYQWSAVPVKLAPGYGGYRLLASISHEEFARGLSQKGRQSENLFLAGRKASGPGAGADARSQLERRWSGYKKKAGTLGLGADSPEEKAGAQDPKGNSFCDDASAMSTLFGCGA